MKLAFYKGTRPGLSGVMNRIIRWWTHSPYSHCEVVFSDGACGSASFEDGGVRLKTIEMSPDKWDLIEIDGDEVSARNWFMIHYGQGYDVLGLFGFIWRRGINNRAKWFCSEACAASLHITDSEQFTPHLLKVALSPRG